MATIRLAVINDYAQLPAIEADAADLFYDFGTVVMDSQEPMPASFYENMPPESVVYVAVEGDQLAGFAIGLVVDCQAHLKEVSVKRAFARQGIGKRLVQRIMEWAHAGKFKWLTLTTYRDLPFNAPFYRKLGFQDFEPEGAWLELCAIRERERQQGLEAMPRVAMRLGV